MSSPLELLRGVLRHKVFGTVVGRSTTIPFLAFAAKGTIVSLHPTTHCCFVDVVVVKVEKRCTLVVLYFVFIVYSNVVLI